VPVDVSMPGRKQYLAREPCIVDAVNDIQEITSASSSRSLLG
jgi:hypothetical protein